eukprot:COSAG06_NODE_2194_length_7378_cov_25.108119_4_plen_115_part_00
MRKGVNRNPSRRPGLAVSDSNLHAVKTGHSELAAFPGYAFVTGCTAHGGGWVWVIVVVASALTVGAAVVHCRCKDKVADAKPQQDEESVARDSTAETATLAGKSMKQASDTSYP